jgi:predicted ATPase
VYDEAVQALQDEIGVDPMPETTELARQIKLPDGDWRPETGTWAITSPQPYVSSPFVGRGKEITQLTKLLTQAAAGQGQLALISGEPGIGKSRLVGETAILAHRQGFHRLSAHCYQVEQAMPYQPLIDLIRQVMARDDHWSQLAPVWLRELAILVPEVAEVDAAGTTSAAAIAEAVITAPPSDEPDENRQGRLFQAIFHLFAKQAERNKLLLVIEDIHWADPSTLQCLHYLSRHIVRVPITLIFTLRGEDISIDADLAAMLHSLGREAHLNSLPLARLTEADTIALLVQTTDTAPHTNQLSNWLYQETGGNPFFFTSLLQAIREEGLLDDAPKPNWQELARTDQALTLPDAIRDLVRDRLQRLSKAERETLDWMAVYSRRLDFSTLHAISHQPQMTLLNAVEQLRERQLLVETTGQYDFDHNKIREVVYHDLSAARRVLYHRQIAETLEALPPSPDRASILAHHFERGEGFQKALMYWMQAGKHALDTYAYQQAARHYERALALTDQPVPQMDAYLGLGHALILLDDHKAATTVIHQGLHLAERFGDDTRRAHLLYAGAQNACRQHRSDGGKPEVEAALFAAEEAGDEYYLAQSLLLLTEVHESSGDLSSALGTASRAQTVSSQLNDNLLEARAQVEIGFLHAQRAEFDQAVNAAELGLKLLAKTDDRSAIAYAWNILGRALGGRGDYRSAFEAFHRSQEEAQIIGDRYLQAQVFNMLGWLHRELGDIESGLDFNQKGVDFAVRWGKPSPEISARLNICLDVLHLGDPERVLVMLDEIEAQINAGAFGFHNWRWRLRLLHTRGLCFLSLNEPAKAVALAEDGLPLAETNVTRKYVALNHALKGRALAELGKMDEAISEMETAISLSDDIQYQPIRWAGRQKLAKLYRQIGREDEAIKTSSEADDIIQTIAASIEDDNLRVSFLKKSLPQ